MGIKYEDKIKGIYAIRDYLKELNHTPIATKFNYWVPFEENFDNEFKNYLLCLITIDNSINPIEIEIYNSLFNTKHTVEEFQKIKHKADFSQFFNTAKVLAQSGV